MDATNPLPPDAQKVFTGQIFSVWQWRQRLYDNSEVIFERVQRRDYVFVIAVRADHKILMIDDEQPDRGPVITAPGGGVDDGETPSDAARRELLEETGYSAPELKAWYSYRPHSKIEMRVHGFIAQNVQEVAKPQPGAGEKIQVLTYTFEELLELGHAERFRDVHLRVMFLEAKLDPVKKETLHHVLYG